MDESVRQFNAALGADVPVPTEHVAARFIRARKGDIPAAVEQYRTMCQWRLDQHVEGITGPDLDETIYTATCPHRNHGYTKQGLPVYVEVLPASPFASPSCPCPLQQANLPEACAHHVPALTVCCDVAF
eukprot:m.29445 g.29445  ORF g.29445 m.29445 type:complete len:129 (-) comp40552_c0_seq1:659-1045(-)